jgi:hypothetical protein
MTKLLVLLTLGASLLGARALRRAQPERRALLEFGHLNVPRRLDTNAPQERDGFALFPFTRVPGGLQYMGSNTPYAERLVVAAWSPATRDAAEDALLQEAAQGVRGLAWRAEPGAPSAAAGRTDVGEGRYEVNMAVRPAWVLTRADPARGVTFAYMAWKQDASLERARGTLEAAARSFESGLPAGEYLALARVRPARERAARLATLRAELAARGVAAEPGGPPVEKDGRWYAFARDERDGDSFTVLIPLGALPAAPSYRESAADLSRPESWLAATYFAPSAGDSAREVPGRGRPYVPPALERAVAARVAAREAGGPARAYFFAGQTRWLDNADLVVPELRSVERAAAKLAARFAAGRLYEAAP